MSTFISRTEQLWCHNLEETPQIWIVEPVTLFGQLFPDRQVVGVPSYEILLGGGNIHCQTQQVPSALLRPVTNKHGNLALMKDQSSSTIYLQQTHRHVLRSTTTN